jgi:lysyl endopeptidase
MKKIFLLFIFLFAVVLTYGQVETKYYVDGDALNQVKFINDHPNTTRKIELTPFDVQKQINEDELYSYNKLDVPYRFGKGFDLNISLEEGEWLDIDSGRLWSMEFKSSKAYSINFVFDKFYLPDHAELYVTNAEKTILYGPVTSKQNPKNGFFLTDLIMGDDVTIYLFEPYSEKGKTQLNIKRVVHA